MVTEVTIQKVVQRIDRILRYGRCQCGVPVFAGKIRRKKLRDEKAERAGPGRQV